MRPFVCSVCVWDSGSSCFIARVAVQILEAAVAHVAVVAVFDFYSNPVGHGPDSLSLSVGMLPTRPKLLTGVHHPLGSYDRFKSSTELGLVLGQGHGEKDWDGGPRWGDGRAGAGRRQADRLPWPALPMKPPARGCARYPHSVRRVAACLHAACRGTPPAPWFPDRPRRLHLAPARAEGRRAHASPSLSHARPTWIAALPCTAPLIDSRLNC
jgi:hypothetical protein